MKSFLFFLFIANFALANSFALKETSLRFKLHITKTFLSYESEQLQKKIEIKTCNLPLARKLNQELISLLPKDQHPAGIPFEIDGQVKFVKPNSFEAKKILSMDQRMMHFFLEERRVCAL